MPIDQERQIRIGILSHEFLINIGANDFLKLIISGLALRERTDIVFLHPRPPAAAAEGVESAESAEGGAPHLPYDFYAEACPRMSFVACDIDPDSLETLRSELGIDVFLPSIHVLPKSLPYVTYWPDCQPKYYPEFFDEQSQRVRDERILGLLASGKPMINNSRNARDDMVRFYGADPGQIFNFPVAPNLPFEKLVPRPELCTPYGLHRRYFIMCNQFWVHKSIETVIEAAAIAKKRGYDVDVVLTGKMEEPRIPGYIDSLRQRAADLDVDDTVNFLGYIPKDDQLELMKNAVAVIQPTLFEGGPGGGSIYDAMSLGVRAIVSDIAVNRELPISAGRLALFEKRNATDLADRMGEFLKAPYKRPSSEDLYQLSKRSVQALSGRLYEAIDYCLSLPVDEAPVRTAESTDAPN